MPWLVKILDSSNKKLSSLCEFVVYLLLSRAFISSSKLISFFISSLEIKFALSFLLKNLALSSLKNASSL